MHQIDVKVGGGEAAAADDETQANVRRCGRKTYLGADVEYSFSRMCCVVVQLERGTVLFCCKERRGLCSAVLGKGGAGDQVEIQAYYLEV